MRRWLGLIHRFLKIIFRPIPSRKKYTFVKLDDALEKTVRLEIIKPCKTFYINDRLYKAREDIMLETKDLFPLENAISDSARITYSKLKRPSYVSENSSHAEGYSDLLREFVLQSIIPSGWANEGLHYAGYILERRSWCLPSWTWTNAAVVKSHIETGNYESAEKLANKLLDKQLDSGGWLVRFDFKDPSKGVFPVIAPNDSAYIASKAMIPMYQVSEERNYLESAIRCAEWIIEYGNHDGLVYIGYDASTNKWTKSYNIVDIGFTAELFCQLFKITGKNKFREFATKFINKYLSLFYIGKGEFATSIASTGKRIGGRFARGHAWALEGLIPYYEITQSPSIGNIIDEVISFLIKTQSPNGAWLYDLRKGIRGLISGFYCKGTPIIASIIDEWSRTKRCEANCETNEAVEKAIAWCKKNTRTEGPGIGCIFSYNFEGAIVHSNYTSTAFVYSNAYLLRLLNRRSQSK